MRSTLPTRRIGAGTALGLVAATLVVLGPSPAGAAPDGSAVVINEVYGGGGNANAVLTHDFVELFNPTDAPIDLDGKSLQYRAAGNTGVAGNVMTLAGEVPAGSHFLVQLASNISPAPASDLPEADLTGGLNLGVSNGQIFLAEATTGIDPDGPGDEAITDERVVDFVGFGTAAIFEGSGAAPAPSASRSIARPAGGTDTDDNAADFTAGDPTPTNSAGDTLPEEQEPGDPLEVSIAEIQGEGMTTPLAGQPVITRGVVTAAYPTGGFFGFYLQEPGSGQVGLDLDEHSGSQAVFVYQPFGAGPVTVEPGDHVEVTGTAGEYAGATQVSVAAADDIVVLDEEVEPVVTTTTTRWPATAAEKESLEGMLYRPTGDFTVSDTYTTNQFGEVLLARGTTPLVQPTQVARPGTDAAAAVAADNQARRIVLDDGSSTNFLASSSSAATCGDRPTPCLVNGALTPPYLSLSDPVRVGAGVTFTGDVILTEGGSPSAPTYRFQPVEQVVGPDNAASPVSFENTRTAAPDAARLAQRGTPDVTAAAFNVLNYFTTLGEEAPETCVPFYDRDGDGSTVRTGCSQRGAWDAEDLAKQQEKLVAAINAMDADVVGLMEIENSAALGEEPDEATETLVAALNAGLDDGIWAANPSSGELPALADQDVITNAIIYRADRVERVGESRALGDLSGSGQPFVNAREPLAQAFRPIGGGTPFLMVVNHFKSKGSPGPFPGDADTGDGQGASNGSRVLQASALRDWIPSLQSETGVQAVLLVGDFNAYGQEDPMAVLYDAGYVNASAEFGGVDAGGPEYSYTFQGLAGSLDHVLVNEAALATATGSDIWQINAPEAVALEYSRWNYHAEDFHDPGPFRSSDHDPVLVGLALGGETEKAASTTRLRVAPRSIRAGTGTARVTVTVAGEGDAAPGGEVRVLVGATERARATVGPDGRASLRLGPLRRAGVKRVRAICEGDDATAGSRSRVVTLRVRKARASVEVTARRPAAPRAGVSSVRLRAEVTTPGLRPRGVVEVRHAGRVLARGRVDADGDVRLAVGRLRRPGVTTLRVVYLGHDHATRARTRHAVRVRR